MRRTTLSAVFAMFLLVGVLPVAASADEGTHSENLTHIKNLNYAREDSPDYASFVQQIDNLAQAVSTERARPGTPFEATAR